MNYWEVISESSNLLSDSYLILQKKQNKKTPYKLIVLLIDLLRQFWKCASLLAAAS